MDFQWQSQRSQTMSTRWASQFEMFTSLDIIQHRVSYVMQSKKIEKVGKTKEEETQL